MPRPAKHANPRNRILARARALVVKKGFDKVSLRAIAEASDFSPASLYEYFPNKEALFGELASRANKSLHTALARASEGLAPRPALAAVARAYVAFAHAQEEDFLLLFSRSVSKRRSLTVEVPRGSAYQVVLDLVERGFQHGELASGAFGSADGCAYAFWSVVHGQATLQLTTLRKFETDFVTVDEVAVDAMLAAMEV